MMKQSMAAMNPAMKKEQQIRATSVVADELLDLFLGRRSGPVSRFVLPVLPGVCQ
jgi:hypothetical protein